MRIFKIVSGKHPQSRSGGIFTAVSGKCPHCGGNLFLESDFELDLPSYQRCLQCARQYELDGRPVSRLATVEDEIEPSRAKPRRSMVVVGA